MSWLCHLLASGSRVWSALEISSFWLCCGRRSLKSLGSYCERNHSNHRQCKAGRQHKEDAVSAIRIDRFVGWRVVHMSLLLRFSVDHSRAATMIGEPTAAT